MVMQKLLYIAPHLSTGGLPQYLCKKIELLKDEFDIYLVEWVDHTGGRLVVQKDKIRNLIPLNKFFTLGDNKQKLISIINQIQPDIIHLEEIPEFFMDYDIAKQIYNPKRRYIIIETSHDSSYIVENKQFFPDKFMFVSQWQINQYENLNIPKALVEYPIEYKERPDRTEALQKLGLDPDKKHVLHIGLFTPRKNQAEFFKYAKSLPEFVFHCVGNQADNFKYYWEPLMENKPDNIIWWNERTDVDNFYSSMDLFLFTSRGTERDKETMPLVIREALSWQIPILIYNLPVYLNYFDKFETVNYLEFDDFNKNCNIIKSVLHKTPIINYDSEVYIVGTYPNTSIIEQLTIDCLHTLKNTNRKIITTSHYPLSEKIQELSDYVIYDKNNILTNHTFNWWFFSENNDYKVELNVSSNDNDVYHGPASHSNIYNAMILADKLGFNKAYLINYDYHLKNNEPFDYISQILNKHTLYSKKILTGGGDVPQMKTAFMAVNPKTFIERTKLIKNRKEWDDLQYQLNAPSNGLEALWYQMFKDDPKAYWEDNDKFDSIVEQAVEHKNFSQVEYVTVLPVENDSNNFALFIKTSNDRDNRLFTINIWENDNNTPYYHKQISINTSTEFYDLIPFSKDNNYLIECWILDYETGKLVNQKVININKEYIENILPNNGIFIKK